MAGAGGHGAEIGEMVVCRFGAGKIYVMLGLRQRNVFGGAAVAESVCVWCVGLGIVFVVWNV